MKTSKKIGVLGNGEVGKAIASFYKDPFVQDLESGDFKDGLELDVLHVCIPYRDSKQFYDAVWPSIENYGKKALVFIHSTVAVGTTEKIAQHHQLVVHAPIRGVHPNLKEGIETFVMFVGADSVAAAKDAERHLASIGIMTYTVMKSRTTEVLKLLDTTYYGVCIAYHQYAYEICEREGLNFEIVMSEGNRTYNNGYEKLGKFNVIRPVLSPPRGKIGGHCVIPNAELLRAQFGSDPLLEAVLRHK